MGTVLGTHSDLEPEIIDGHCKFCPLRNHNTENHICSICGLIGQHSALAHCKRCKSLEHTAKDHLCWCPELGHTQDEHWNRVWCDRCAMFGHDPRMFHSECDRCDLILLNHSHVLCLMCSECTDPRMPHVGRCACGGCQVAEWYDPDDCELHRCIVCFKTPEQIEKNPYDITLYSGRIPRKKKEDF